MTYGTFWIRIGGYCLKRLGEPSTWAGISGFLTVVGINIAPTLWQEIASVGVTVSSLCLTLAREGRNKPDNPTLPAAVTGEMPPPKQPIVPPTTAGMQEVSPTATLEADPAGVVHVEPEKEK